MPRWLHSSAVLAQVDGPGSRFSARFAARPLVRVPMEGGLAVVVNSPVGRHKPVAEPVVEPGDARHRAGYGLVRVARGLAGVDLAVRGGDPVAAGAVVGGYADDRDAGGQGAARPASEQSRHAIARHDHVALPPVGRGETGGGAGVSTGLPCCVGEQGWSPAARHIMALAKFAEP